MSTHRVRVYNAALLAACALALPAQERDQRPRPSARTSPSLVYDDVRRTVLLLDGYSPYPGANHPELSELWSWNGTHWTLLPTAGPPSRFLSAAVFDARRGRIVSFGGRAGPRGEVAGDTWEWDGRSWRPMPDSTIGRRDHHVMAYDALRGTTVLFGGGAFPRRPGPWSTETWEWNGVRWLDAATVGPPGRALSAMVYDSRRREIVLFGGVGEPLGENQPQPNYGDTWIWNGRAWRKASDSGPPARAGHAMAFDERAGVVLLHGGSAGDTLFGDLWEWDGTRWREIAMTGATPGKRRAHAMAYDASRQRTVMYGGVTVVQGGGSKPLDDTWEFDGTRWSRRDRE